MREEQEREQEEIKMRKENNEMREDDRAHQER